MTYRTQNYKESLASIKGLFLFLLVLPMPAIIVLAALTFGKRAPHAEIGLTIVMIAGLLGLLFLLPWLYYRGYRNLAFTLDEDGLTVRFLKTLHLCWAEILSVEKVRPAAIVGMRLCGLGWSVTHGLFSTKRGRAWLWLAGEPDAIFLKTPRRNYLFAPERIDEFLAICQSKIRR